MGSLYEYIRGGRKGGSRMTDGGNGGEEDEDGGNREGGEEDGGRREVVVVSVAGGDRDVMVESGITYLQRVGGGDVTLVTI